MIYSLILAGLLMINSPIEAIADDSVGQSAAEQRAEDSFEEYFKRKNDLSDYDIQKGLSEEDFIVKELGRERRVYNYVKIHPEVAIGKEYFNKFDIRSDNIKLKHLVGALGRLGAKIYLSPRSNYGDIAKKITIINKDIREVGIEIATKYGVSIRYFRSSGIYIVE